jgi:hypothetical protein
MLISNQLLNLYRILQTYSHAQTLQCLDLKSNLLPIKKYQFQSCNWLFNTILKPKK